MVNGLVVADANPTATAIPDIHIPTKASYPKAMANATKIGISP